MEEMEKMNELREENERVRARIGEMEKTSVLRKATEEALRQSEIRFNEAQRIAHIGSWELDIVNNLLTWSDEIYRIFEIDPKRFGASYEAFLDTIHPDDRAAVDLAYTNSLKTRSSYAIEHRLLFPDGRVKHVYEQGETFFDSDGKPLRSVGTVQDITERKKAEEKLKEQLDELQRWKAATVGRELRMKELKDENEMLKARIEGLEGE